MLRAGLVAIWWTWAAIASYKRKRRHPLRRAVVLAVGLLRVPTRFVPKYTLRVAHLKLSWVDLALVGLKKAGIANQPGARNVGV